MTIYPTATMSKKDNFEIGTHEFFGPKPAELVKLKNTGSLRHTLTKMDVQSLDKIPKANEVFLK